MPKFRKKPVKVEAVQWTGDNLREIITFTDGPPENRTMHARMKWEEYEDLVALEGLLILNPYEGRLPAAVGDWIIKGVKGEHYPCKPDIFEMTYEAAEDHPASTTTPVDPGDMAATAEVKLTAAGVFKGAGGLRGLVEASEFWAGQPYETRLYYGDGIADYLHRGVLQTAVKLLDELPMHPLSPALPARMEVPEVMYYKDSGIATNYLEVGRAQGWNACLDAIEKNQTAI